MKEIFAAYIYVVKKKSSIPPYAGAKIAWVFLLL